MCGDRYTCRRTPVAWAVAWAQRTPSSEAAFVEFATWRSFVELAVLVLGRNHFGKYSCAARSLPSRPGCGGEYKLAVHTARLQKRILLVQELS